MDTLHAFWHRFAVCHEQTELFFSVIREEQEIAKGICRECPCRRACLTEALERREDHGVWGGTDERDRRRLYRKRGRDAIAQARGNLMMSPRVSLDPSARPVQQELT